MTRRMIVLAAVAGLLASFAVAGTTSAAGPDLGPNVMIFDPSMPTSQIQAAVDAVASQQVANQFGSQRYALLFKPGTYGSDADPLNFQVGYYTAVAGLGRSPSRRRHQRLRLRPQPVRRPTAPASRSTTSGARCRT